MLASARSTILSEEYVDGNRDLVHAMHSHWPIRVMKNIDDVDWPILKYEVDSCAHLNVEDQA
jgi:hypothetical protein